MSDFIQPSGDKCVTCGGDYLKIPGTSGEVAKHSEPVCSEPKMHVVASQHELDEQNRRRADADRAWKSAHPH